MLMLPKLSKPIIGRVDRAFATEIVDSGLIPGWLEDRKMPLSFPGKDNFVNKI